MKKLLFTIILFFTLSVSVQAASATISVSADKSTVVSGSNVVVTVRISSKSALGAWEYSLNYNSTMFDLASSDTTLHNADSASNASVTSISYKYTFKAKKTGSATFSVKDYNVLGYADEAKMSVTPTGATVSVKTQAEIEASYSENNYLKSLSITSFELSPEFNKETLEYTVELPNGTTEITIDATKEDSKASIAGVGTIQVSEGINKLEIIVTAQNGNERKYLITANVKELDPIVLTVDNVKYNVVRKLEDLTKPLAFEETTVFINGEEVPAFYSAILKYTLIGLKDEEGGISLYIYSDDGELSKYNEVNFGGLIFLPLKTDKKLKYESTTLEVNGIVMSAYKYGKGYYIVYGVNVETGKESFYVYDEEENTLQRYNEDVLKNLEGKMDAYFIVMLVFGGGLLLSTILLITMVSKRKKRIRNKNI